MKPSSLLKAVLVLLIVASVPLLVYQQRARSTGNQPEPRTANSGAPLQLFELPVPVEGAAAVKRPASSATTSEERVMVPRSAILEREHRKLLFVYDAQNGLGRAKWRYVTTGIEEGTLVEIVAHPSTEMVKPGEIVLVSGHETLVHDAPVRVVRTIAQLGNR